MVEFCQSMLYIFFQRTNCSNNEWRAEGNGEDFLGKHEVPPGTSKLKRKKKKKKLHKLTYVSLRKMYEFIFSFWYPKVTM